MYTNAQTVLSGPDDRALGRAQRDIRVLHRVMADQDNPVMKTEYRRRLARRVREYGDMRGAGGMRLSDHGDNVMNGLGDDASAAISQELIVAKMNRDAAKKALEKTGYTEKGAKTVEIWENKVAALEQAFAQSNKGPTSADIALQKKVTSANEKAKADAIAADITKSQVEAKTRDRAFAEANAKAVAERAARDNAIMKQRSDAAKAKEVERTAKALADIAAKKQAEIDAAAADEQRKKKNLEVFAQTQIIAAAERAKQAKAIADEKAAIIADQARREAETAAVVAAGKEFARAYVDPGQAAKIAAQEEKRSVALAAERERISAEQAALEPMRQEAQTLEKALQIAQALATEANKVSAANPDDPALRAAALKAMQVLALAADAVAQFRVKINPADANAIAYAEATASAAIVPNAAGYIFEDPARKVSEENMMLIQLCRQAPEDQQQALLNQANTWRKTLTFSRTYNAVWDMISDWKKGLTKVVIAVPKTVTTGPAAIDVSKPTIGIETRNGTVTVPLPSGVETDKVVTPGTPGADIAKPTTISAGWSAQIAKVTDYVKKNPLAVAGIGLSAVVLLGGFGGKKPATRRRRY